MSELYKELTEGERCRAGNAPKWQVHSDFASQLRKRGPETVYPNTTSKLMRGLGGGKVRFALISGQKTDGISNVFSGAANLRVSTFRSQSIHHTNYTNHSQQKSFLIDTDKCWKQLSPCDIQEHLGYGFPLFAVRRNNHKLGIHTMNTHLKPIEPYNGKGDDRSSAVLNIFQLNTYLRARKDQYKHPLDFIENWSFEGVLHDASKGRKRIGVYPACARIDVIFRGSTQMADIFTGGKTGVIMAHGAKLWIVITQQKEKDGSEYLELHPVATHDNSKCTIEKYKQQYNGQYAFKIGWVKSHNTGLTRKARHTNILHSMLYDSTLDSSVLIERYKQIPLLEVCLQ
jgi:hypothetical protein